MIASGKGQRKAAICCIFSDGYYPGKVPDCHGGAALTRQTDNPVFASFAKHGVILRFSVPSPKLLSGLSVFRVLLDRKDYTPFSPTPARQALPVAG